MLNKKEFVDAMAERNEITKKDAAEMYDIVFKTMAELISEGYEISISGLGRVKIVEHNARTARNPKTGSVVDVPAKKVPRFQFSNNVKENVAVL